MKYIVANTELVRQHSSIDVRGRRRSSQGKVMLNDKDVSSVMAETYEQKLALIEGVEISEFDAINELNKEVWK